MRRSGWVTGATVAHVLLGVFLSGVSLFLLSLIRSPEIMQGEGAAEAILGLKIAASIIGAPALLVLAGAYGLWKDKLWGWWVALLTDAGVVGVFMYSLIDDGWKNIDSDLVALAVVPLVAMVFLLLPAVRRFYCRSGDSRAPQTVIGPPLV